MNIYKMRWNKKYFLLGKLKENSKERGKTVFFVIEVEGKMMMAFYSRKCTRMTADD